MTDKSEVFSIIKQEKAAELVVRQIEELILTGVYGPGDKLPSERKLEKKLNVSRPILREAIKNLEDRHLLVIRRGDGTRVADVLGSMFREPIIELFRENPRATRDYLEFRREIEAVTARYAARRATPADHEIITHIFRKMEKAHEEEDFHNEVELDISFHAALGEAAHNVVLLHTLRSCYQLLRNDVFFNLNLLYRLTGARDLVFEQHRTIWEAVIAGNEEKAEAAAIDHIRYAENSMHDAEQITKWQVTATQRLEKLKEVTVVRTSKRGK